MSAPPPARKKRKTEEQANPAAAGGGGALSIEMIGKVASFANYGDDLMNICKAVGPKDSGIIRYTCLRNNMGFLRYTLKNFADNIDLDSSWGETKTKITAWMEVNTDWRKHCTLERTVDEELASCTVQRENNEDDDGQRVVPVVLSTNPLILFNNPAVAIEVGFTVILKHLVEEVGIDVNSHAWCGYTVAKMGRSKVHLLAVALTYDHASSFDYLLSREETNVHEPMGPGSLKCVWETMYEVDSCSCKNFRALIGHSSFEPNRFDGDPSHMALLFAFSFAFVFTRAENDNQASADILVRKFKILLDVGANPELVLGAEGHTVLEVTKVILYSLEDSGTNPLGVLVGRQMIEAMEEKVAGEG